MVKMSRAPFARRKRKKPELEETPVIRMYDVPAPEARKERGEPTPHGKVIPKEGERNIGLRLLQTPEKIIRAGEVKHEGELELLGRTRHQKKELPKIYGVKAPPVEVPVKPEATASKAATRDHIKLGEGQTDIWREGLRPQKKEKKE